MKLRLNVFSIICFIDLISTQLTPDFTNIKNYFKIENCFNKISTQESKCHKEYLDSFEQITQNKGPFQESDEYKKLVCCSLWDYFDCILMSALDKCDQKDVQNLRSFPSNQNIFTAYCIDYQYGTYRCWKFPLWAIIICVITAILVIIGAIFGFWFWKHNKITYWRHRRRY